MSRESWATAPRSDWAARRARAETVAARRQADRERVWAAQSARAHVRAHQLAIMRTALRDAGYGRIGVPERERGETEARSVGAEEPRWEDVCHDAQAVALDTLRCILRDAEAEDVESRVLIVRARDVERLATAACQRFAESGALRTARRWRRIADMAAAAQEQIRRVRRAADDERRAAVRERVRRHRARRAAEQKELREQVRAQMRDERAERDR